MRTVILGIAQLNLAPGSSHVAKEWLENVIAFCQNNGIRVDKADATMETLIYLGQDEKTTALLKIFFTKSYRISNLPFDQNMIIPGIRILDMIEYE